MEVCSGRGRTGHYVRITSPEEGHKAARITEFRV